MTLKLKRIVNFFIQKSIESNGKLTPISLQKLLYFSWGMYWIDTQKELFEDEFESWPYGPVVPSVYNAFKAYGHRYVNHIFTDDYVLAEDEEKSLQKTWQKYGGKLPFDLVEETHKSGSPWDVSKKGGIMSKDVIKLFFKSAHVIDAKYRDVLVRLSRT